MVPLPGHDYENPQVIGGFTVKVRGTMLFIVIQRGLGLAS
jgi:hypothetical protein